ncbi:MAG: succinylglutamate desuccinylase/aspartoacylase family protein [Pseudomonadales bacterium]
MATGKLTWMTCVAWAMNAAPLLLPAPAAAAAEDWGPIEVAGRSIAPGAALRFPMIPDPSYEASYLNIPIMVARGRERGPTLCLTAGIHGDELNGVEVARRAFIGTAPASLSGTLIALPILNADGFRNGSRYLPDRRDLNRFWPGSSGGSVASIIANAVFTRVIELCDALIDLHTASFHRSNQPQIRVDVRHEASLALARHFADTTIVAGSGPKGSLRRETVDAGIPAIIYEAGEPMRFQLEKITPGVAGIYNVMRYLGMTAGEASVTPSNRVILSSSWARVPRGKGGFFFPEAHLGERVEKGQSLGQVIDPFTDAVTPILAHRSGEIIGSAVAQPVLSGYALFHIGVSGTSLDVGASERDDDEPL